MPFSTKDSIVAIATPPGRGGIGIVRLSGPDALPIAHRLVTHDGALAPRHATLTKFQQRVITTHVTGAHDDPRGVSGSSGFGTIVIDQVVATFFPGPASYTGEDVVEISAHGSPVVLQAIVSAAVAGGARLAEPGEFTMRAFLNGRIDLPQAEAVADLVAASTPLQARAAFDQLDGTVTRAVAEIDTTLFDLIARLEASVDFPDEGYHFVDPGALANALDALIARTAALLTDARRGRLIREGLQVAIVGEPNVGKSSLFNALVGSARAIVTDVAGTTRDLVTEVVDVEGLRVTLVDTAGLRDTQDPIEIEGVQRSRRAVATSDLVLTVVDGSRERLEITEYKGLTVASKADLPTAWAREDAVAVSAMTGAGLDELRRRIVGALDVDLLRDRPAITNVRHIALVERAHDALSRARAAAGADGGAMSEEFVLADLSDARAALEEISGRRAPGDVLEHIFSKFCIGK
jgi:tRNA modification GTPase